MSLVVGGGCGGVGSGRGGLHLGLDQLLPLPRVGLPVEDGLVVQELGALKFKFKKEVMKISDFKFMASKPGKRAYLSVDGLLAE